MSAATFAWFGASGKDHRVTRWVTRAESPLSGMPGAASGGEAVTAGKLPAQPTPNKHHTDACRSTPHPSQDSIEFPAIIALRRCIGMDVWQRPQEPSRIGTRAAIGPRDLSRSYFPRMDRDTLTALSARAAFATASSAARVFLSAVRVARGWACRSSISASSSSQLSMLS